MKCIGKYIVGGLAALTLMTSCNSEEDMWSGVGEGTLKLNVALNSEVDIVSKAVLSDEEQKTLNENCMIYLRKGSETSGNLLEKFAGVAAFPATGYSLSAGPYSVTVIAGGNFSDENPVSEKYLPYATFEKKYLYKGTAEVEVIANQPVVATVPCTVQNTLVKVNFDKSLEGILTDCAVQVSISEENALLFAQSAETEQTGCFLYSSNREVKDYRLGWSFTATDAEGNPFQRTGVIENVEPATLYNLTYNISIDEIDNEIGSFFLDLKVDTEPLGVRDEHVEVWRRPQIEGNGFDIAAPVAMEPGKGSTISLWINASSQIKNLEVSCDDLDFGGSHAFDFITMTSDFENKLAEIGISAMLLDAYERNFKLTFDEKYINTLEANTYNVVVKVKDMNGKESTKTLTIVLSDADVATQDKVNEADVWATKATVKGIRMKETATGLGFEYAPQGSSVWTRVTDVTEENGVFTAQLTGLTPNTTYRYRAFSDEMTSSVETTFTTEAMLQPENAGFEEWNTSSKAYLLCNNEGSMWWDTGNHGSATMNKNVTIPDETVKHSGRYSAKLASQFVGIGTIGKFAAGNAFVGKYLATNGTNGVLGWGRPFTSRPKALKGYIRYSPVAVTHADSRSPLQKGDMDNGQIFVAVGDWAGENYDDGTNWAQIVKTAGSGQFFDQSKNNAGTIGFGQCTWTAATAGEGMVEFEIPIEYWRTDARPTRIILVMSASKYGDYFSGGNGSTMWVDDLELIYE